MNNGNGIDKNEWKVGEDYVDKGFHRLEADKVKNNPPRIKWGKKYNQWPDKDKIRYLEKLASAMNEAARLLQDERDELLPLIKLKEAQVVKITAAIEANNNMLITEVTRMNEDRQKWNQEAVRLNQEIKKLKVLLG